MTDAAATSARSHIEGGVDAIVVGASLDGLVAGAYLARAGLHTVLFERAADPGLPIRERPFADGVAVDGEHLIHALSAAAIDDLDLYRHGVSYAARRAPTTYFFEDGPALSLGGDLRTARIEGDENADTALHQFITETLEAAAFMRPLLFQPPGASTEFAKALALAPRTLAARLSEMTSRPAEEILERYFASPALRRIFGAEAAFRAATPPHEPMSFSPLLARWAGEVSGLQGAVAIPKGGAVSVINALRRAAQKARVDIRASSAVTGILIEHDRTAGVSLEDGGQVRAPIVISAADARTTYLDMIGPTALDPEFQRAIGGPRPPVGSAQLHAVLSVDAGDADYFTHRCVYAPPPDALRRAFAEASAGRAPADLILEAVFVSAFDEDDASPEEKRAPGEGARLRASVIAHPLPLDAAPDAMRREAIIAAILKALEPIAPGAARCAAESDLFLPADAAALTGGDLGVHAGKFSLVRQLARAATASSAGNIGGLYFCGPEAQIGYGLGGEAGRCAALAALRRMGRSGGGR